ncbi:helix-turn-helix domain-containing protein [Streptosporangium sandarakinum]|uniref:Tetratricopeptide (TPR) repeat protein n=1 Tax=Streptosporangium sandarakinum TaxID=1260955 RepID=A0A852V0M9_9ACTN|nr:helix-turn-helix transcriptional regulator [Streptosporangium sandarakinum]NYF40824.1 tetratricopeptide (TPR) repeat protein [Streptosporangium sandarakinum]
MSGWSKRDINKLRDDMIRQGRGLEEIAEEIRLRCGGSRLAAFRLAHGWSQPDVIVRYRQDASALPIDQPTLSRLEMFPERGSRAPQATQIIALAGIYGTTPLRLLDPFALDRLEPSERNILMRCNAGFGSFPAGPVGKAPPPVVAPTRSLIQPESDSLQRKVEMAAHRALRFAVTAEGSNIGPETLDQLREEATRLTRAYQQQPLTTLMGDLVDLQDVAFRLLEGRQRPAEAREMYLMAGVLSGMLAKASHDLGDPNSAMKQARASFICADNAGHDGLRTWTRGLQSMIAYWAGWPHEAARYAQLGGEFAGRTRGTGSVWLPAQEARVWAVLGNGEQALAAIERANDAREQVEPDELDELGGIMTFPRPRQLYYDADTRVWLPGQEEHADRVAEEAIIAYEEAPDHERSFSDEAGARADQALARVTMGDLEGAAEALDPVLELPADQRIGGIVASAMRVHTALRDPGHRGAATARELQQRIEVYGQVSAGIALPRGR